MPSALWEIMESRSGLDDFLPRNAGSTLTLSSAPASGGGSGRPASADSVAIMSTGLLRLPYPKSSARIRTMFGREPVSAAAAVVKSEDRPAPPVRNFRLFIRKGSLKIRFISNNPLFWPTAPAISCGTAYRRFRPETADAPLPWSRAHCGTARTGSGPRAYVCGASQTSSFDDT